MALYLLEQDSSHLDLCLESILGVAGSRSMGGRRTGRKEVQGPPWWEFWHRVRKAPCWGLTLGEKVALRGPKRNSGWMFVGVPWREESSPIPQLRLDIRKEMWCSAAANPQLTVSILSAVMP